VRREKSDESRGETSMSQKIFFLALSSMLFALSVSAHAKEPTKMPRIGYVSGSGDRKTPGPLVEAFRQGLHDRGYVEGKNILVEYRYVEGGLDRVPALVAELVQLKVDVLVAAFTIALRAAKQATKTIPIVMVSATDPVAAGFVDSLARPGGNITGVVRLTRELSGKRLELLKEAVPRISRVAVLWDGNEAPGPAIASKEYEASARSLKLEFQSLEVRGPNADVDGAFQAAAKGRANALMVVRNRVVDRHSQRIIDLAIKNRLPSAWEGGEFVEAGGLLSYSANDADQFRRAATYVDKILKGAKPAELPVEQPTKFELVINLKTAKKIGVIIPQSVLYRADRVIR
jgi:putative tryptophan/tyrosine transport system substrate-binding protein